MDKELDIAFKKACDVALSTERKLPPDIRLRFYAYYKQATRGNNYMEPSGDHELRSAFKLHAWFQLSNLTEDEAKLEYINLVKKYLT